MLKTIQHFFDIKGHETTLRQETMAGMTTFFTIVYIIAVNAAILADAGIPLEAGIVATILTSFVGCLLMGLWGNSPIVLVPGMGVNAFFSYTIVHSLGLTWQEALAVVFISGLIFTVIAFTRLASLLSQAIPESLKHAITVGIGLFLTFIGLKKGGIVIASSSTLVALGHLTEPTMIVTIFGLVVTVMLFIRNVTGSLLIGMIASTILAYFFGLVDISSVNQMSFSLDTYASVFGNVSFTSILSLSFWIAVFSLTMVIVFENMGLLQGMLDRPEKFSRSYQANAISTMTAGLFGTSPTVSTVESAAGIAAGGKTGLTSITTGTLLLASIFFIPVMKLIPDSAIAPVLIIIGGLMMQNILHIPLQDFSEGFPAFLVIVLIPLTYSIADGIAFGFIAYPLLKIALGKRKEVAVPLYLIAGLFFMNFVFHVIG